MVVGPDEMEPRSRVHADICLRRNDPAGENPYTGNPRPGCHDRLTLRDAERQDSSAASNPADGQNLSKEIPRLSHISNSSPETERST
jgi:hypothetical protein